jgi:ribosomal protein S8
LYLTFFRRIILSLNFFFTFNPRITSHIPPQTPTSTTMKSAHELCDHILNAFASNARTLAVRDTTRSRAITHILYQQGFFTGYSFGDHRYIPSLFLFVSRGPYDRPTPTTPNNIASRRIWIKLKYRDGRPALNKVWLLYFND